MNVKYSSLRCALATTGVCAALLSGNGCTDDFGYQNLEGKQIAFNIIAPDIWHDGMDINENEPTTHCLSVRELAGDGDTRLYLHTVVADNPVEEAAGATRGTPIRDLETFRKKYTRFSLSGICHSGDYPLDESQNELTTEYAHDFYFSTADGRQLTGEPLMWPNNDKVKFFAFAPTVKDFEAMNTGGALTMSGSDHTGSPTLTYTVPAEVEKQIDLMTASTKYSFTPTATKVDLEFGHALTAVRIACGKDMLAGKISKVEISGVFGSGSQVIGSNTWTPSGQPVSYTISKEIKLPADNTSADKIHAGNGTDIAGTKTDNLTFMLLPQTLPEGALITIVFTDDASGTKRTISGSIAGQTWEAGKIITYSVSPSSIHINASVEISKKGVSTDNPTGDVMPYSGVWYDVKYNPAKVEIVQAGVDTKEIATIPIEKIKFKYRLDGSENWTDCTTDADGLLQIAPQPAYVDMRKKFNNTTPETGSEDSPESLTVNGKTANCYLVDKAGYFSLPLVYGNGNVATPVEYTKSLKYYPDHNEGKMPGDGKITGVSDAVLCWQDAPDLIDPASVKVKDGNLVFHIRKQTITQGNALLAVRNGSKEIIWSWHIWVTPYKEDFYSKFYQSKPDATYTYELAKYNLGWCDSHDHNASRKFSLRAFVDMSAYGGEEETPIEIGTYTQDVFKGSDAGDNTYYQWGRKDPMLGGIYNDSTPCYTYTKYSTPGQPKPDKTEFTMENKQVFNQYNQDGYNYSFCKNPGDMIETYVNYGQSPGEASKGVTIGYAIRHPYMFVTNSSENKTNGGFDYRNHWHIPYKDHVVPYLSANEHIMFNAWNSAATDAGYEYGKTGTLANNAAPVTKTVFDPCPPEFQVPPIHALKGVYDKLSSAWSYANNAWTIKSDGGSITFPLTGVRDYALRSTEWTTVVLTGSGLNHTDFYKISMPAFRMLTFVSSATIVDKKDVNNAYQVYIFSIDKANRNIAHSTSNLSKKLQTSSNSYGLAVRPMHYIE